MAETTSPVYDLTYPSAVTLEEMSAIAIVAELWREEIARAEIKTLNELKLAKDIVLKKVTPNIPSTIYGLLIEYTAKFCVSIADWIKYHSKDVLFDTDYNSSWIKYHSKNVLFDTDSNSYIELLNKFHDFVWDWNGDIHYVRTAKRMMLSDRFAAVEKFKIACWYCFEDDIERIWPFVSSNFDLAQIDFNVRPLLYYWICCLRNELNILPNPQDEPIDELMFSNCRSFFSLEYFWNRVPHERRSRPTSVLSTFHSSLFARFTLRRLNEFELEEFLAETGVNFMYSLLIFAREKVHVLPAWMYIRNKLNRSQFIRLIEKLLEHETRFFTAKERLNSDDEVYLCCEIWKNYPENMKQWVLNDVLLNETLFKSPCTRSSDTQPREMRFLITVLLDASFEQRHKFWCNNWRNLISGARVRELLAVMKLCFRDENDVSLFKEQHMSKYENIRPYCVDLLRLCYFKELRAFLSFCCSNEQKLRELKQQLLRSNVLGENSILSYTICRSYKELNALVEDAFAEDVDLLVEFKNQFVSSPVTERHFCDYIDSGDFDDLIQFVETFAPEEAVHVLKQRLFDVFNEYLVSGVIYEMKGDELQRFLVWLLDSEDEIGKFKQSLPVDDIFCNVIQDELELAYDDWDGSDDYMINVPYPHRLDDFLNWYFNNDAEEIRKIKKRYSDWL
ncbi:uncharacterized protein LOC135838564 [Planococcus citri]|uniref:uncharacterized protein LOC135838564 n=1 Tax=Planococcus citri TaxID=170843 RepID=UPI0031F78BD8